MMVRSSLIALLLAASLLFIIYSTTRDPYRAVLLSATGTLFLSASGHVYRIIKSDYLPAVGNWFHILLVVIEISLLVFLAQKTIWLRLKPARWQAQAVTYLNLFAVLTFVLPLYQISAFWLGAFDDTPHPWTTYVKSVPTSLQAPAQPPDIYYIILDGYGQAEMLSNVYGYDNSEFIRFLQSKGFYIAEQARSNYFQTPISLASSLNMSYLDFAPELAGKKTFNRLPLYELLNNNHSLNLLHKTGYTSITTETGYNFTEISSSDYAFSPFHNNLNDFESFYVSTSALSVFIETSNPISEAIFSLMPPAGYRAYGERMVFSLQKLEDIAQMTDKSPKFVFIHVAGPHPPFVFDSKGNPIAIDKPFLSGDGIGFAASTADYQRDYIEQLKYINILAQNAIEDILTHSTQPPIIILQGDHGPASLLNRDNLEASCLYERASILNAYYFPDSNYDLLYPSITPVNSFRVLFNQFFGQDMPLLTDETYFSPNSYPYQFTNITSQITKSCP
ncbi:MAG: hypothetical protein CVU44_05175 [Chloroflexi bacterium HGW-Chloroflexi-6]|nr:MAG: hypothetical protein CVU44_05175 [Chloroflexi bacterium HGW-Chloroflexi-6]